MKRTIALFALLALVGCGTGTIQTSTGPKPASTVIAQDTVADLLHVLTDGYKAAVAKHDAETVCSATVTTGCTAADVHLRNRAILLSAAQALRTSWDIEIAWKQGSGGASPIEVFRPLVAGASDFLALLVQTGAITQAQAGTAQRFIDAAGSVLPIVTSPSRNTFAYFMPVTVGGVR